MGKYWKPTPMTGERSMFKDWQTDISLAPHDQLIMGRIYGSNRARAVKWDEACQGFRDPQGIVINICQWILFADFAKIRQCVWRNS